jgi:hypothetical protein
MTLAPPASVVALKVWLLAIVALPLTCSVPPPMLNAELPETMLEAPVVKSKVSCPALMVVAPV